MTSRSFIRQAIAEDYDILADVMFDAVRNGPGVYTEEQRHAWVPLRRTGAAWIERLESQTIFVAADTDQVFGFMSLAANGYIDLAFIRPSAQGTGLFRRLYHTVEDLGQKRVCSLVRRHVGPEQLQGVHDVFRGLRGFVVLSFLSVLTAPSSHPRTSQCSRITFSTSFR